MSSCFFSISEVHFMKDNNLNENKKSLIEELERKVANRILEKSNVELLKKLIINADSLTEAISIAELGTTYLKGSKKENKAPIGNSF